MKTNTLLLVILAISLCLPVAGQSVKSSGDNGVLKAGMAKIDITPDYSVRLYGYAARKIPSQGIHDHIYARAVAFENNGKRLLMISSDIGSITDSVYSVVKKSLIGKYKIGESDIFLAAIHSHSAPVVTLDPSKTYPVNIQYTMELIPKLVTLAGEAFKNLRPVKTGAGIGYSSVGANRRETAADGSVILGRNPYGTTDKQVLVFKITDTEGKPAGVIYDYATHATSMGPGNLLISGDLLGLSEQFVEQILGNNAVAPIFVGASGNIDPWYRVLPTFNTEKGWIPETILLGTLLGEEVVHVFNDIKEPVQGGKIVTSVETLQCHRKATDEKGQELPASELQKPVPVTITAARIGDDVAFISFSVEMLTEIGMAVKTGSPFKYTFVISHCNGTSGYLPLSELYKEGGYEINSTHFAIGSDKMVINKALRMLYDLK